VEEGVQCVLYVQEGSLRQRRRGREIERKRKNSFSWYTVELGVLVYRIQDN
jgi:hypothetical protein